MLPTVRCAGWVWAFPSPWSDSPLPPSFARLPTPRRYICLAAPRAMFGAQLAGQLIGAVITPLAFMLFFRTGQVRASGGAPGSGAAVPL